MELERPTEREREVVMAIVRGSSKCGDRRGLFAQIVLFAYESGLVQVGDVDIGH